MRVLATVLLLAATPVMAGYTPVIRPVYRPPTVVRPPTIYRPPVVTQPAPKPSLPKPPKVSPKPQRPVQPMGNYLPPLPAARPYERPMGVYVYPWWVFWSHPENGGDPCNPDKDKYCERK